MEKYLEESLTEQLNNVISELGFNDFKVYISSEQLFKNDLIKSNEIYVVYKDSSGQVLFGNKVLPVSFYVLSEQNSLDKVKNILDIFIQTYNQMPLNFKIVEEDEYGVENNINVNVYPYYSTPVVANNFIKAGLGVRSMIYMTGTFVIMKGLNDIKSIKYYENGNTYDIKFIHATYSYNAQLDTQPFYNDISDVKSVAKYSSFVLNLTTQFTNDELMNKVLKVAFRKYISNSEKVNATFYFIIEFINGIVIDKIPLKLAQHVADKEVGALTTINLAFYI